MLMLPRTPVTEVPTIAVLPNKETAKILKHPNGPVLGEGALWPNDSFTARRLADKSIVRGPSERRPAEERAEEAHQR